MNYEFDIRSSDAEEGIVTGIAVPFGQIVNIGGFKERFERGAIEDVSDTKLFWNHQEVIGKVLRGTDTDEGFLIEAKISKTPRGEEVRTLLADGVIDKFSVGFIPVEDREEDGVTVRTKVRLKETSLVPFPAYSQASVLSVREEEPNTISKEVIMDNTNEDVVALRSEVEDLSRQFAALEMPSQDTTPSFRSYGDYISGVIKGDEDALALHRAYTGGTISDSISKDAWVSDVIRIVDNGRPSLNAFRKSGLPAAGMNVEYPKVKTNGITVAEQVAEGDDLVFGEIALETATAPVKTLGGWTSVSRQAAERSSVAYLDAAFRALAIAYAKNSNAYFTAVMDAAIAANLSVNNIGATPSGSDLMDGIADASIAIHGDAGVAPEFILVSSDAYKLFVSVMDTTGRPVVAAGNPSNSMGSADIPGLRGSFMGLPLIVDASLATGSIYVANKEAFTTFENGGPLRLSDDNITNLTKDFSVYGYVAVADININAAVKLALA